MSDDDRRPTRRAARDQSLCGDTERGDASRRDAQSHDAHRDVGFASTSRRFDRPLSLAAFRAFVAALPPAVLRAKGIVRLDAEPDARGVFQLVGKRSSLTFEPDPSGARHSEIVVFGPTPRFDPASADELFAALERASALEAV